MTSQRQAIDLPLLLLLFRSLHFLRAALPLPPPTTKPKLSRPLSSRPPSSSPLKTIQGLSLRHTNLHAPNHTHSLLDTQTPTHLHTHPPTHTHSHIHTETQRHTHKHIHTQSFRHLVYSSAQHLRGLMALLSHRWFIPVKLLQSKRHTGYNHTLTRSLVDTHTHTHTHGVQ